jgi:iron(III) transport system permease protein
LFWFAATSALLCLTLVEQEKESEQAIAQTPSTRDVLESATSLKLKQIVAGLLLFALLIVPLINLLIRGSFYIEAVDGNPVPRYSISHLGNVLCRSIGNYQREFIWTFLIGMTSSLSIMILASTLVWKARTSVRFQILLGMTWVVSCTLPGPLIGSLIGSLFSLSDSDWINYLYDRTILAPVLATVVFCWPFPPLILWFVFRKVSSETIDHARLDGAGDWTIFWRFGIGDQLPKLFGCWLVTLAICLGELSASQLVLPPGMDTLPRLMLGLLHAGVEEMTAGITLVLMVLIGILSCIGWKITRWNAKI